MPSHSTVLDEEGLVIPPTRVEGSVLEDLAAQMRNPRQRLADLRAQRAANLTGARRLRELEARQGRGGLTAGMDAILDYAERRTRARLGELPDGTYSAEDVLEGGASGELDVRLRVVATVSGDASGLTSAAPTSRSRGTSTVRSR